LAFLPPRRRVNALAGRFHRGRDLALRQSIAISCRSWPRRQRTTSFPPASKVTFNSDLIHDVLRPARARPGGAPDAASGLTDARRLGDMLARVRGRITLRDLDGVSPRPSALVARVEPLLTPLKAIILSD
jgi:hypothetical protein